MSDRPLGPGEDRVVVGQDGAGAALAEQITVDSGGPADEAIRRRARDQVVELATAPLRGDRETPVLDERASVHEVGDILARGSPPGRVTTIDGLGSRLVEGELTPIQHLGQIVAQRGLSVGWLGHGVPRQYLSGLAALGDRWPAKSCDPWRG